MSTDYVCACVRVPACPVQIGGVPGVDLFLLPPLPSLRPPPVRFLITASVVCAPTPLLPNKLLIAFFSLLIHLLVLSLANKVYCLLLGRDLVKRYSNSVEYHVVLARRA